MRDIQKVKNEDQTIFYFVTEIHLTISLEHTFIYFSTESSCMSLNLVSMEWIFWDSNITKVFCLLPYNHTPPCVLNPNTEFGKPGNESLDSNIKKVFCLLSYNYTPTHVLNANIIIKSFPAICSFNFINRR